MKASTILLAAAIVATGLVFPAAFPRYEWRSVANAPEVLFRVDRWTGAGTLGAVRADWGRWVSAMELRADSRRKWRAATG